MNFIKEGGDRWTDRQIFNIDSNYDMILLLVIVSFIHSILCDQFHFA